MTLRALRALRACGIHLFEQVHTLNSLVPLPEHGVRDVGRKVSAVGVEQRGVADDHLGSRTAGGGTEQLGHAQHSKEAGMRGCACMRGGQYQEWHAQCKIRCSVRGDARTEARLVVCKRVQQGNKHA